VHEREPVGALTDDRPGLVRYFRRVDWLVELDASSEPAHRAQHLLEGRPCPRALDDHVDRLLAAQRRGCRRVAADDQEAVGRVDAPDADRAGGIAK